MGRPKNKNKGHGKTNGASTKNSPGRSSVNSFSESDNEPQTDTKVQGSEFEIEVKTSLRRLTKAFFGDKRLYRLVSSRAWRMLTTFCHFW